MKNTTKKKRKPHKESFYIEGKMPQRRPLLTTTVRKKLHHLQNYDFLETH